MRVRVSIALCAAFLVLGPVVWGATIFVDDGNCPGPGDGSTGNPFCRIQAAYDAAASGDEIRVRAGIYPACVLAADTVPVKNVHLVADAFVPGNPNSALATTIDTSDLACTFGAGTPTGAVRIGGSDSSILGFRITGGDSGGLVAIGSVTITSNIIEGNSKSGNGAGVYLYPDVCSYGNVTQRLEDNIIRQNTATFGDDSNPGRGAGVFVRADAPGGLCGNATVRLEGNTIADNSADGSGGGIWAGTNTALAFSSSVVITQNTIDNNDTLGAGTLSNGYYNYGYGGGVYALTFGYGAETIEVSDNRIRGNNSEFDFGGGVSASVVAGSATGPLANQVVRVDNNTITGNTAGFGAGGIDALSSVVDLPSPQIARLFVRGNTVTGNTADFDGGGILATFVSGRATSANMEFEVSGNRISSNSVGSGTGIQNPAFFGGGIEANVFADADPTEGTGTIAPADATLEILGNRIDANQAVSGATPRGTAGGMFVFARARGDAVATVRIERNTFANNVVDDPVGVGALHVESETELDTDGLDEGLAIVEVNSSIFVGNDEFGIGGPFPGDPGILSLGGTANFTVDVDFNDFFDNAGGNVDASWIVPAPACPAKPTTTPEPACNVFADPLLNPTSLVPASSCSPVMDRGDPALPFAAEPPPNGHRVNMGHTGGVAQFCHGSPTFTLQTCVSSPPSLADVNGDRVVDGLDLVRLSVSFNAPTGGPRFDTFADFDSDNAVDGEDLSFLGADFGDVCP